MQLLMNKLWHNIGKKIQTFCDVEWIFLAYKLIFPA